MKKIIPEKIIFTKKIVFILSLLSLLLLFLITGCTIKEADSEETEEEPDEERASRTDRAGLGSVSGYRRTIERPGAERSSAASPSLPRPGISGTWIAKRGIASGTETEERVRGSKETSEECLDSAECREGLECIDHNCGTIAELYETDCEQKCNFNQVAVSTSDGEEYTSKPGEGSYSYAGAIEWRVASVPDYCPEDDIAVPIRLIKKANSRIVSEEVITIRQGDASGEITHPTISRVSFEIALESIGENCG